MTPNVYTVTAGNASQAYQTASKLEGAGAAASGETQSFGDALSQAISGAIETGNKAEATAAAALSGHGNITDLVTAVSKAELALQTTATVRDRMVQAYQDIMRMAI